MQQERRLRKTQEFARVMREGQSWATPLLVLKRASNGLPKTRFGFVAGKRVGNAVIRNRVKRRLREVARRATVEEGWDLVFIARTKAASTDYHQLAEAMESLLRRARLLKANPLPAAKTGQ